MTDARERPSVGRMVHLQVEDWEVGAPCHAAIITMTRDGLASGWVDLTVFRPDGVTHRGHVRYDQFERTPGTWHWPERV